jgi:hypothetical protein
MILIYLMLFVQLRTEEVQHQLELLPFTFDAYELSIHGIIHKAYTHRINNIHDILIFITMLLNNHHKRTNRDQIIHYFFIITFNYCFNYVNVNATFSIFIVFSTIFYVHITF